MMAIAYSDGSIPHISAAINCLSLPTFK